MRHSITRDTSAYAVPDSVIQDFRAWCKTLTAPNDGSTTTLSLVLDPEEAALVFLLRNPAYRPYVSGLTRHVRCTTPIAVDSRKWDIVLRQRTFARYEPP